MRPRLRSAARIARAVAAAVAVLVMLVAVGAPVLIRGERFGHLVERMLPETRGRIQLGGGQWSWAAVFALLTGRPADLAIDRVLITDPEGTEVLFADRVSARVEVHRAPRRIVIHDLRVTDARWRFAEMTGKRKAVGFLAAFEGVPRPGGRATHGGGLDLTIEGARLEGLDATFEFSTWGLVLNRVHGAAGLSFHAGRFAFEVGDAEARTGGQLRILRLKALPFSHARIRRIATTAAAPDAIVLAASDLATGRSRLALDGVIDGVYGITPASKRPGIDLTADVADAADAVGALLPRDRARVGGSNPSLHLQFKGRFAALGINADARGFDVEAAGVAARDLGFKLDAEPNAARFRVRELSLASPDGGRLAGDGTLQGSRADGALRFDAFATRPLLPAALRPFASGTLDGTIRVHVDLQTGSGSLEQSSLAFTRADAGKGPRSLALNVGPRPSRRPRTAAVTVDLSHVGFTDGTLRLPRVVLSMWGGRLRAEGQIALWDTVQKRWLPTPLVDVAIGVNRLDIERLTGLGFVRGAISFRARARGSFTDLALDLAFADGQTVDVLHERLLLPTALALRVADAALTVGELRLRGPGDSQLHCAGRIAFSGRLALDVGVSGFPVERLPGLERTALPLSGLVSGDLRLSGVPRVPEISGRLAVAGVAFQGRPVGDGSVTITAEAGGAIRTRGHLIEAIAVDSLLSPKRSGLEGEATLTIASLKLDPFLPALTALIAVPGNPTVTGIVSGTVVARIAPGQPATAAGHLSELKLVATPPAGAKADRPAIEVHAQGEIPFAARSGASGTIVVGPGRFGSTVGEFQLSGQSNGDDLRGAVEGRIALANLVRFGAPWLDRMQGAFDVNVTAARVGADGRLTVSGTMSVAQPIWIRAAMLPIELRIPGGRIDLHHDAVETTALPLLIHVGRLPLLPVSNLDGSAKLSARIGDISTRPTASGTITIDRFEGRVPAIGSKPIRAVGGEVQFSFDGRGLQPGVTRVDLPFAGEAEKVGSPAAFIEAARFALRLHGAPPDHLQLTGDVELVAARIRASALGKGGDGGGGGAAAGSNPAARGSKAGGSFADHLQNLRLDLRLRSRGGGVVVEVPRVPDLRVDLDMQVAGTVNHPAFSGEPRGSNIYSKAALALWRLFR